MLRDIFVDCPNHSRCSEIKYLPLRCGFHYLVAVIDCCSRHVRSCRLPSSICVEFCPEALDEALEQGTPENFSTNQGAQYTSRAFTGRLLEQVMQIHLSDLARWSESRGPLQITEFISQQLMLLQQPVSRFEILQTSGRAKSASPSSVFSGPSMEWSTHLLRSSWLYKFCQHAVQRQPDSEVPSSSLHRSAIL